MTQELDLNQWSTSRLLLTATRLVENAWNKELADFETTQAGLTVLLVITLQGSGTQADIARRVRVQPQTMTRTLNNLESRGYIDHSKPMADQKRQVFMITPAGTNVVETTARLEQAILPRDPLHEGHVRRYLQQAIAQLTDRRIEHS